MQPSGAVASFSLGAVTVLETVSVMALVRRPGATKEGVAVELPELPELPGLPGKQGARSEPAGLRAQAAQQVHLVPPAQVAQQVHLVPRAHQSAPSSVAVASTTAASRHFRVP